MLSHGQLSALRLLECISGGDFRFVHLSDYDCVILRAAMWFHWFGVKVHSKDATIAGLKIAMQAALGPTGKAAHERNESFRKIALATIAEAAKVGFANCWKRASDEALAAGYPEVTYEDACARWSGENLLKWIVSEMGLTPEQDDAFLHGWEVANLQVLRKSVSPREAADEAGRGSYIRHRAYFIGGYICGRADRPD